MESEIKTLKSSGLNNLGGGASGAGGGGTEDMNRFELDALRRNIGSVEMTLTEKLA